MNKKRLLDIIGYGLALLFIGLCASVAIEILTATKPPVPAPVVTSPPKATTTKPFSFAAAGDFSKTINTDIVLKKIASSSTAFTLALGDLGYGGNGTETAWCDYVHQRLGSDYPFQIVAGNHDDGSKDGDITQYGKCLPNKIEGVTGDYGREYYFDYGGLARFIMISPDINNYGATYTKDSDHSKWLSDVIDAARTGGMKWIVLSMHKNCITIGEKTCEIGEDLMNLAVEKKVDLILQGHEHGYMRSKQLGLSSACPVIAANKVEPGCIAGQGGTLTKAAGSVIVITGTGGIDLRPIRLNDPELGYFDTWNGSNVGQAHGFSKFTVSETELKGEFVPIHGDFADSFVIR